MFQAVFLSIIRSLRLYIQHQIYVVQILWLLASKQDTFWKFRVDIYMQGYDNVNST
jgi:hypothetical protein